MFTRIKWIVSIFIMAVMIQPALSIVAAAQSDREKKLIEGAKKEGQLVLWHIGPLKKKIVLKPFTAKYPFIKVKTWRSRGSEILTKALEEATAGKHTTDLTLLGRVESIALLNAGVLGNYEWPNTKGWLNQPKHGGYRGIVAGGRVPVFNSKILPKEDWPASWDDLKNPKYRGKAILSASAPDGPLYTAYLWRKKNGELDWERSFAFWKELFKALKPRVGRGFSGPTELVASGTVSIMPWGSTNAGLRAMWKGASLKFAPVGTILVGNQNLAIMKDAPHPNAARLFADYISSKEGLVPYANSRAMIVNSPELGKLTRANKEMMAMGFKIEQVPLEMFTTENIKKASSFWFKELGIKKGKKGRRGRRKKR